jgi:hypothetical protein
MPNEWHLDQLVLQWENFEEGDLGWLALMHPGAEDSPTSNPSGTTVDVTATAAAYFAACKYMEFWQSNELEEVIEIASVSGTVVTLASAIQGTYTTSDTLKGRLQTFNTVRGTKGLDGGFRFLGANILELGAVLEQTDPIPGGLIFYLGLKTGVGSQRSFSLNFVFREKDIT